MNTKTIFTCVSLGALALGVTGCHDEAYPPLENGLYLEEAMSYNTHTQQIENITVDSDPVDKTLTARLAKAASEDVKVVFELDESLIDAYNEKNGTSYQLLPEEYLDFEPGKEVVIPAGMVVASSQELVISPYTTPNAEVYAVPVRMKYISGPVEITGNADHILYLLASPNKQKSIVLHRNCKTTFNIPAAEMSAFTVEFWIKVNNKTNWVPSDRYPWFGSNGSDPSKPYRQKIFGDNCGPITIGEFMLRWWADGAAKIGPTLQCQLNGSYFDSNEWWEADTWYHIAYTFDGESITLYRNGTVDKTHARPAPFTFENISLFNFAESGSQATAIEVEMAQIRIWSKCLPAANIADGMSRQIPGDSDGLYAYWPCNEGEGNILKGSGKIAQDVTVNGTVGWSDKVYSFANPNAK